jgi:homoserine dehydrogenase
MASAETRPFGIALLGCGTVGGGVAKLLSEHAERLAARAGGRPIKLCHVVVRDPKKPRAVMLPSSVLTTNYANVLADPTVDAVVEVVGGVEWAKQAVLQALAAGKHVVTANKALLALHGGEIFDAGRRYQRAIAFEASVGGGIPIIAAVCQGLAANQILSVQGILNGTCNYILTAMTDADRRYIDALREAQARGYAEADPTLDVDGTDAAHKLAILTQIAFGVTVPFDRIPRRGIADIDRIDVRFAKELGYTIRLLAEAWLEPVEGRDEAGGQLALHVAPVMLRKDLPLALVRDAYNAIFVAGDAVGSTLYYGRGAGQMPTASAVVADIIDLAVGRAQQTFRSLRLWSGHNREIRMKEANTVRSRYYLRLTVQDRPGVLADITRILADHHISISSVIQHEAFDGPEGELVPLVILSHTAPTGDFLNAVGVINQLDSLASPAVFYPVAD